ncbi:MAG: CBS and ACT domain-containing protein [Candidatus Aquicultor sp.]
MFIDRSMTKNVITIKPEAGILEAKEKLEKHHIHSLPVVEGEDILIGIVTDRDIRSALPSGLLSDQDKKKERARLSHLKIEDIMTKNPVTVSPSQTLEDALLMMHKIRVGAFPVVDQKGKVIGIISRQDLMRAFINVLGIEEPGTLLCILAEDKVGTLKKIVDAISEERISFGSVLVARHWEEGKRMVFPYLLTNNVTKVKKKLKAMGFTLLNPMEWYLDQLPKSKRNRV